MSLALEREAAADRRWQGRVDRTARGTLYHLGRGASLKSAEAYIRETWPGLDDGQVEEVLARTGTMREEEIQRARHLAPEEIEMAVTEATRQTREVILGLLRQDPTMTSEELWLRAQTKKVKLTAKSSFVTVHCSWARKQLGIGRGSAEEPTEADDACPKDDPDCLAPDDGEWHSHEACEKPEEGAEDLPIVSVGPATLDIGSAATSTGRSRPSARRSSTSSRSWSRRRACSAPGSHSSTGTDRTPPAPDR